MEPIRVRRSRRGDRHARNAAVEVQSLESRQLLTWSPLGFSLPDLSISGYAAPIAAYGEEIAVTVRVQNLGASSIYEPLALEPGSLSTADARPTTVDVFLGRSPRFGAPGTIKIGEIDAPGVRQNRFVEVTDTVQMPPQLPFLPGSGGTVYLFFRADAGRTSLDFDRTNNTTRRGVPVEIAAPLPELVGLSIDVPPVMQPGDAIAPSVKIANLGTADPDQQVESFEVALVASDDPFFGPGDEVLATYNVQGLPPLALVPTPPHSVFGDANVVDPINVLTLETSQPIILPSFPAEYYIGVIIDPTNTVREISEIGRGPDPALNPVRRVGPPIPNLPPAGVVVDPVPSPGAVFPFTPYSPTGRLPRLYEGRAEPPLILDPVATMLEARRSAAEASGVVRLRVDLSKLPPQSVATGPAGLPNSMNARRPFRALRAT